MSQDIVCKECAFSNPAGSKFCNNCGTKLPLGTHIICVNCGTSNTIDRVFCDHCGTRLIPEEPRTDAKAKEESATPMKGAFSLPARRPGETGDLDPKKVPDWLKTGKTGGEDEPDQDLPRLEELTRKQHTDDLPEWLVDEEDSDPIIHAPTIISTEFYKDLLGRAEAAPPQTDDLFSNEADLPDWLRDSDAAPSQSAKPKPSPEESDRFSDPPKTAQSLPSEPPTGEKSLTSWLSSPLEEEEDDWPLAEKPNADSLTSWLSQDADDPTVADQGKQDSLTSWLSTTPSEEDEDDLWSGTAVSDATDVTDWLSAEKASESEVTSEGQDSLTDWLSEFPEEDADETLVQRAGGTADTGRLTAWFSEAADEPEEMGAADSVQDSLTDWLTDFPDDDADATWAENDAPAVDVGRLTAWFSDAADEPEEEKETSAAQVQDSLTDWLTDFPEEDVEEVWAESEADVSESGRLTAWFSATADEPEEEDVPEPGVPADDDAASWFDAFLDEDEETAVPFPVVEEPDSGGLSAWLSESAGEELVDEDDDRPADSAEELRLTGWLEAVEEDEDKDEELSPSSQGEAARLAAWFSGEVEQTDEDEEQFGWLDEPEPPPAAAVRQELPSDLAWLDETEEELASIFQSQPGIEEELPDWLVSVAASAEMAPSLTDESDEDGLEDIFKTERYAAASEIDFLRQTGSLHVDDEMMQKLRLGEADEDDAVADSILSDEPDWLAALAGMGPDDLGVLDSEETVTAVPAPDFAESFEDETAVGAPGMVADEAAYNDDEWASEGQLAEIDADDMLPAWISQLDATAPLPDLIEDEGELSPGDALPDWVASLRPGQTAADSGWHDRTPDTLAGVPEELAGADLPGWLQDISRDANDVPAIAMPADTQLSDIPDWLQPGLKLDAANVDFLADSQADALDMGGVSDEWSSILDDLPPAVPLQELLPKADIPAWVMELKPVELTGETPKAQSTGPEESFGPLSGLRGVVTVEPVIALPRLASPIEQFVVSPEQRQQVELLRQMALDGQGAEGVTTRQAARDISGWIRPLFVLVLVLAIILGLRGELPVNAARLQPSAALTGVDTAVRSVASGTVLVAFEYTPAMAGELTPEAETLLMQLAAGNTTVLTLSQYTPGVEIADEVSTRAGLDSVVPMGYLPGGAIGLRRLGECLNLDANCDAVLGAPLTASQKSMLDDVSLIVVLTADRQTLINWIEQVGTPSDRPMVAGVTQSLTPLALPYFESQQLTGIVNGIPGTAVYQQTYFRNDEMSDARILFNAQVSAQILVAAVLILGALIYLISGFISQRRAK